MHPAPASNPLRALSYRTPDSNPRSAPNSLIRALLLFLSVFALAVAPAAAQQSFSYSDRGQMQVGIAFANYRTPLTPASNGMFYSISTGFGSNGSGYVYMVDTNGNSTDILDFDSSDATAGIALPIGNLIQGPDGFLYGATLVGGQYNWGVFYKIWVDGSNFTVLHSFDGQSDGGAPIDGITLASDGNFYAVGNSVYYSDDSASSTNHPYHSAGQEALLTQQKKGSPHQFLRGLPLHRSTAIRSASRSITPTPNGPGPSGCSDYPHSAFYQLTTSGDMTEIYCEATSNGLHSVTGPLVEINPLQFLDMTSWSDTLAAPAMFSHQRRRRSGFPRPIPLAITRLAASPPARMATSTSRTCLQIDAIDGCTNNNVSGVLQAYQSEVLVFTPTQTSCTSANNMLRGLFLATDGGLYGASPSEQLMATAASFASTPANHPSTILTSSSQVPESAPSSDPRPGCGRQLLRRHLGHQPEQPLRSKRLLLRSTPIPTCPRRSYSPPATPPPRLCSR